MSQVVKAFETAMLALAKSPELHGLSRYFRSGPGQYGEGDQFLGISVPEQRQIAKTFAPITPLTDLSTILHSPWHEFRLTGFLILVFKYQTAVRQKSEPQEIVDFYLSHLARANNWDLVDTSAYKILGHWLLTHPRDILRNLANSQNLWLERVAVVSTLTLIAHREFTETLTLCRQFMTSSHDLIHKACGWMLREVGKRDVSALRQFLDSYQHQMPRTMLRSALEKLPASEREIRLSASRPV